MANKPFWNLELSTIPKCNMACRYCFEGDELQSKQRQKDENIDLIIKRIKDIQRSQWYKNEYSGICINLWGGEPTLNYKWNKLLIEKLREANVDDNPYERIPENTIKYFMYSNGFSINKVQDHINLFCQQELLDDKFRMQISYDGVPGDRIDHKGNQTYEKIANNIEIISKHNINLNLTIKATLQHVDLIDLKKPWLNFYKLYKKVKEYQSRTTINFAPTLNYVDDLQIPTSMTKEEYLNLVKDNFIEVSKYELKFYEKYGHHLMTWFSENIQDINKRRLTNCSAGVHMAMIDMNNTVLACHGALYASNPLSKHKFIKQFDTNLNKNSFVDDINKTREELKKVVNKVEDSCINCSATVCYKCPIINVERKNLKEENNYLTESFQDRDPRHCEIYKLFGTIDRSLFQLKQERKRR